MRAAAWRTSAVILLCLTGAVAGCSREEPAPDGKLRMQASRSAGGAAHEIRINFTSEPPVLDSSRSTSNAAFTIINAFHEGLYRTDPEGRLTPGLAKSLPSLSDGGRQYTIDLREEAVWSDGRPVRAQDFVYSFKRTLNPATRAQYSFMLAWIAGGAAAAAAETPEQWETAQAALGVRAVTDKRLEITLEKPVPFFTQLLTFPVFFPQREDIVAAYGTAYGADADKVAGAGPFRLAKWVHGHSLELVKNESYWDAAHVQLAKATIHIVKDTYTGLNLYETDAADLTEIKGEQLQLALNPLEHASKKELTNSYLMYNMAKVPALANASIRRALGLAIDRQALVDTVLAGSSTAADGFVPEGTLDGAGGDFRRTAGPAQPAFDPREAKRLLEQGLRELNRKELPKLRILADDTDTARKSLEFILGQWRQHLGIAAEAQPVPHALRLQKTSSGDFDISLSIWGADYNDPLTFLDMWVTGGDFNEGGYSSRPYDASIQAAQSEADPARRARLLVDAERLLLQDQGVTPLYFRTRLYLKKPNIERLALPPFGLEWELKWAAVR